LGLPEGEEIMTLAFFILTQFRHVSEWRTDRHTDTLRSLLPAWRYASAGKKAKTCVCQKGKFVQMDNLGEEVC